MSSNPSITLKTVAQASGLAVTTVSRALNGHEDIAKSTRDRVRRIAAEIGYTPNRQGQALRTGLTHTVTLIVPSHTAISGYTSSIIFSIGTWIRNHGYELSAMPDDGGSDELQIIRSVVENRRCDGVILTRVKPQDLRVRYLLEKNIPFVSHGRTELATPHAFVDFDNEAFAEQAAQRLIQQGRRHLMLIGPPSDLTYAAHMKLGFERVVRSAATEYVAVTDELSLESPLATLRHEMTQRFKSSQAPDGVVCGGELSALAVMGAIRDAGMIPGKDIAVIAKQTSSVLDHIHPSIDTLYEDIESTGEKLAESLLALLREDKQPTELATIIQPVDRWRTTAADMALNSPK